MYGSRTTAMNPHGIRTAMADGNSHTADGYGAPAITGAGIATTTADGSGQAITDGAGCREADGRRTG